MREEHVHGAPPTQAVVTGFSHGARVVTAAAIIMISVFSGFILSEESFVKSIGLALAAAVLFDAFVVRMTIVPAVMTLLGNRAWWLPKWLDRILPNVDVEGEKLRKQLDQSRAAEPAPALTKRQHRPSGANTDNAVSMTRPAAAPRTNQVLQQDPAPVGKAHRFCPNLPQKEPPTCPS